MPVGRIAQVVECSEGTVKSRLNYARKKLKDAILSFEEKEGVRLHSVDKPEGKITEKNVEDITSLFIYEDGLDSVSGEYGTENFYAPAEDTIPVKSLAGLSKLPKLAYLTFRDTPPSMLDTVEVCSRIRAFTYQNPDDFNQKLDDLKILERFPNLEQVVLRISSFEMEPIGSLGKLQALRVFFIALET